MSTSSADLDGQLRASQTSQTLATSQAGNSGRFTTADIPVEELVAHLLAAKRALSSINTVWRANEIVTSARAALEESVVLNSRAGFIRNAISQQTKLLDRVKKGVENVYNDGQHEFEDVLQALDDADSRLQKTMDVLRSTMVQAALRPAGEEPRTLIDFVDETSVETTRSTLKASIDESQTAQSTFYSTISTLKKSLNTINEIVNPTTTSPASSADNPIPASLHALEAHAHEMASLLSSLVSHFDLCHTAIKQTDGGISAVKDATDGNLSGVISSGSDNLKSPNSSTAHLEPVSEEERTEMLSVLQNDAAEVDDVVAELNDRVREMEEIWSEALTYLALIKADYQDLISAFKILGDAGSKTRLYITASHSFIETWHAHKSEIILQMEDLEGMRLFYENYLSSYDGLILEIRRRKRQEDKMKSFLRKVTEEMHKAWENDRTERENFRLEVGAYLPGDLWEGLRLDATEYEIVPVGSEEAVVVETPEIGDDVVKMAQMRDRERGAVE